MKFGETLQEQQIPEWSDKYLNYDDIKAIVEFIDRTEQQINKKLLENPNNPLTTELLLVQELDVQFWDVLMREILKVEQFYEEMYDIYQKEVQQLHYVTTHFHLIKGEMVTEKSHLIENGKELFRALQLLINYSKTNSTGFAKIVKKHDKVSKYVVAGKDKLQQILQTQLFQDEQVLLQLQTSIEDNLSMLLQIQPRLVRKLFYSETKTQNETEQQKRSMSLRLGIQFGMGVLIFLSYIDMLMIQDYSGNVTLSFDISPIVKAYMRVSDILIFVLLGFGFIIQIFEYKHINYILILELPRGGITSSFLRIYQIAFLLVGFNSFFSLLSLASALHITSAIGDALTEMISLPIFFGDFFSSLARKMNEAYWQLFSILLPLIFIFIVFVGLNKGNAKIGRYLFEIIYCILTPWSHRVAFQYFFGADILTSLSGTIKDLIYVIGFGYIPDYVTFVFIMMPVAIRIIQCHKRYKESKHMYPHGFNLLKYASSFPGLLLNIEAIKSNLVCNTICNICKLLETAYKLYWDYCEDWALFYGGTGAQMFRNLPDKWTNKTICRRPSFFHPITLWSVVIFNFLARVFWVLGWLISNDYFQSKAYQTTTMLVELLRRFIWALFRLDNQQITNCENYIAIRQIPILLDRELRGKEEQDPMLRAESNLQYLMRQLQFQDSGRINVDGNLEPNVIDGALEFSGEFSETQRLV